MRRVLISLIGGVVITGSLCLASAFFIHGHPYRDLPMMPRPFFLFALSPGVIVGEIFHFQTYWIHEAIFWAGNVLAYSLVVYSLPALVRAILRDAHDFSARNP